MKKIFKYLFGHKCRFRKPLISKYVSFNARDVIWECKCGNRKVYRERTNFEYPFTLPTSVFISDKEFNEILNGGDYTPAKPFPFEED